jgi:asparagine synthase (glutamine-hydrolysing)
MSGIVGILNLDGTPAQRSHVVQLSHKLAHRGGDGEEFWIEGPAGFGCQLLRVTPESLKEVQPWVHRGETVVVFDGRLDNREDLLKEFAHSASIDSDSPDPVYVAEAYHMFGDNFPAKLCGDFALALYDRTQQKLLLARDAIGIKPMYYCRRASTFLFASEIKALLAHPLVSARPNDEMLADFLLGCQAANWEGMTFFEGINNLPPSHLLIVKSGTITVRQYWDFDPSHKTRFKSSEEYAEAFRFHFEQAVSRRLRSAYPVAVSVSGGLDSSSIFCVAQSIKQQGSANVASLIGSSSVYPDGTPSDEKQFLVEMEARYGTQIFRMQNQAAGFLEGSRDAIYHLEMPSFDSRWVDTAKFLQFIHQTGSRVLLTGHWGDQMLFDQDYLIDLFHDMRWLKIGAHLSEVKRWCLDIDPSYFTKAFAKNLIKEALPEPILNRLRRFRAKSRFRSSSPTFYTERLNTTAHQAIRKDPYKKQSRASAHFRSLYQQARSGYYVHCMEWNDKMGAMHGMQHAFPFLDRDLLCFLVSIPGDIQSWKGIPKSILRQSMKGIVPDSILARREKADFTSAANESMMRDYARMIKILGDEPAVSKLHYVNKAAMHNELERLKRTMVNTTNISTEKMMSLFGLEIWLRLFMNQTSVQAT